ncbi:RND family efflux transporter MFP subunit [Inhella inkyongensis]|uniref:RND family efflux transporter MFP subunit n=1 Tax=Inhella inkyongensis TaxID=392593 RepID=A0A840SBY3_9BURK|nr:RND family efflux transporter MFP subunit [Inhella inkyongensis]
MRTQVLQVSEAGQVLEFAAEVRSRSESRLAFRVGGKVLSRHANLGDSVKAGQVLMRLDPQDLKLGADAAQAALIAAKANRDQQAADLKRFKALKDQGFISGAELERRESALQAAQSQFEQARAQAQAQRNQTEYAALQADVAGVITAVDAEPGTVVGTGTPVLRLAQKGARDVVFHVPEHQVQAFRALSATPGALMVRVWGRDELVPAKLRELAEAADPATRTFVAKADIGEPEGLKLGQTATVVFSSPKRSGVVKLPMAALFESKGQPHVWVLEPASMAVRQQAVTVGGADGNAVVVTAGLSPAQEVVVAGVHTLSPGQKVRRYGAAPVAAAASAGTSTR